MRSRKKKTQKRHRIRNKRKTVSFQKAKLEKRLHQSPVEARYRTLDSRYVTSCGVCGYLIR